MGIKKFLNKRTIIWGATSLFLAGILITANVLMRGELRELIYGTSLGGPRPIVAQTEDTIDFGQKFINKKAAYENGNKVTAEICEEGMILLKNDNALPLKEKAKVSVFGKNSVNLVYGGSGSAAPDKDGERTTIFKSLKEAGFEYNTKLEEFYNSKASGEGRTDDLKMVDGESQFAFLTTG